MQILRTTTFLLCLVAMGNLSFGEDKPEPASLGLLSFIKVKAGTEKEFKAAILEIIEPSRAEAGNRAWYVQQSKEDPTEFMFYTRWISEQALQDHLSSKPLVDYLAKTSSLLAGPAKLVKYMPIDSLPSQQKKELLIGSWKLEKFTIISAHGEETPFCDGATGLILYEKSGFMSVSINCAPHGAEKAPADEYGGMLFYAGKYSLNGNDITHAISNSSVSSLINKKPIRTIEKVTDKMLVLTGKFGDGSLRISWKRVP